MQHSTYHSAIQAQIIFHDLNCVQLLMLGMITIYS